MPLTLVSFHSVGLTIINYKNIFNSIIERPLVILTQ